MDSAPDFIPDEPAAIPDRSPASSAAPDFIPESHFVADEDKYGTIGQQALTVAEGLSQGVLGPVIPAIETKLGLTTGQDIRNRASTNPILHGGSEVAGFVGSAALPGVGEYNLAKGVGLVGEKAAALTGLGLEVASRLSQIASTGVKGAAELAALQSSDELTKLVTNDPGQSIGSAAINIGLSGILGGAGGAVIGSVAPLWKATVAEDAAKLIDGVKHQAGATEVNPKSIIDSLQELKPNANEIKAAADALGAPVLESQISNSKHIQDLDSVLLQSPSPVGVARQQLLQQGIGKAEQAINASLGAGSELSQVDVGNAIKSSLTSKLESEAKPINELYNTLKQSTDNIPVSNAAKGQITKNIRELDDFKFSGSATEKLGNHTIENLPNINTVDDIKRFKTILNSSLSPTASPAERFAVGQIAEKLTNLEENTIIRQAEKMAAETADPAVKEQVLSLIDQRKQANSLYTALRSKMSDLGELLGKKRIRGPSDFNEFINDLTPEKLTTKLFAKNNSEALATFTKNFPEEAQLLFQHQKNIIRSAAMEDGVINANKVLKQIDKLSPEVKGLLFNKEELKGINNAKTYMESIPDNINPSGTSKAEAYRRFFTNPVSSSIQTAGDFGIKQILSSVVPKGALEKTVGSANHDAFFKSIFPSMEQNVLKKETNPSAFKSAVDYGLGILKGQKTMKNAVDNVFKPGSEIIGKNLLPNQDSRNKLDKSLEMFQDPSHAIKVGGDLGHYMPDHAAAAAQTGAIASNYLNSLKPKPQQNGPFDSKLPVDKVAQEKYNRALDIAQQPLLVLQHAKDGTLLPQDVITLNTIYPDLHSAIVNKLTAGMIKHKADGMVIPYQQRIGLNMIIGGANLDSTMNPQSGQAIIHSAGQQQLQQQVKNAQKKQSSATLSQINKVNALYQTPLQAREAQKRA